MALILPFLLAFVGGATDLARAYQAWLTIESASRSAAEYVASTTTITTQAAALIAAQKSVCLESTSIPGFTPGTGPKPNETCVAPAVTLPTSPGGSPGFKLSTTDPGASAANPIATVHVRVTLQFQTLFPYPMLPHDGWTLSADNTYSVVRGR